MLPTEILVLVCAHLAVDDIVALCQTNSFMRQTLPNQFVLKQALLEMCSFYTLEQSQWDDWLSACSHYVNNERQACTTKMGRKSFTNKAPFPTFVDKPLPSDFYCLCKDDEKSDYSGKIPRFRLGLRR